MGLKWCQEHLSEPKSKLRLPRVTMELDKSLNQTSQHGLEKIDYTSSNEPPGSYCKVLNEHIIGHVLVGQNGESIVEFFFLTYFEMDQSLCLRVVGPFS